MESQETANVYECDIGSTIFLEIKSTAPCPIWYFKGQVVDSICGEKKGMQKKNAKLSDSGRYEGKVDGIVKYAFDVIIHDTVEVKLESTLHLMKKTDVSALWKFNGKPVLTECKSEEGFEKVNAKYSDSGKYEYIEKGVVKNTFDVIIYGCYEKIECRVGSTINLRVEADSCCPSWAFGTKQIWCPHKGFEKKNANFRDSGKYTCKIDNNVTHIFEVSVYEYLFGDKVLGIRITVPVESFDKKQGISKRSISNHSLEKEEELLKRVLKTGTTDNVDTKEMSKTRVLHQNTYGKRDLKGYGFPEYTMDKKPRGIAVIITIDTFTNLSTLSGLNKDSEKCETVFRNLRFDVIKCPATTESEIDKFLTEIANKNHDQYDCFMLLFGSHGGNGFICCSDFDYKKATGFFDCHRLINKFLSVKSLLNKPKIFFFDSCRQTEENIVKGKDVSPITAHSNAKDISERYRHLLIGYGTIVGASAMGTDAGGFYTQKLVECLETYAKKMSLLDVLTTVNGEIEKLLGPTEDETQITEIHTTLSGRIIFADS